MMVISKVSRLKCDEDGVNGASPNPGTVSSTNWPARNRTSCSGFSTNVRMFGVSSVVFRMVAGTG